jgi:hypothetical protein
MPIHLEVLVEEPSAARCMEILIPRILAQGRCHATHRVLQFDSKQNLLRSLPDRLSGYRRLRRPDWRIVILVDEDRKDCTLLKSRLEGMCAQVGLRTRSSPDSEGLFTVVNRIAIEELEAWFFGDAEALRAAYPKLPAALESKAAYRDPDSIAGGTWEALERLLKRHGYHRGGLQKIRAAEEIATHMDPARNRSRSFCRFRDAVMELATLPVPTISAPVSSPLR